MKQPRKLSTASPSAAREAREQAEAYKSIFANRDLELDDGSSISIPPHPDFGMLDDDALEAYEELMFEVDTKYDREPDIVIPEHYEKDEDGVEVGSLLPAETIRGALRIPFRKNNELVKPPHRIHIVQIVLGEAGYKRLRQGGRSAGDVWKIWSMQGLEIRERQLRDPKSAGGVVALAAVPQADSQ